MQYVRDGITTPLEPVRQLAICVVCYEGMQADSKLLLLGHPAAVHEPSLFFDQGKEAVEGVRMHAQVVACTIDIAKQQRWQ